LRLIDRRFSQRTPTADGKKLKQLIGSIEPTSHGQLELARCRERPAALDHGAGGGAPPPLAAPLAWGCASPGGPAHTLCTQLQTMTIVQAVTRTLTMPTMTAMRVSIIELASTQLAHFTCSGSRESERQMDGRIGG